MIQMGANTIARLISACIRSSLEFSDDPAFDGKDCRYDQGSYDDFSSGHCLLLTVYVCIILESIAAVNLVRIPTLRAGVLGKTASYRLTRVGVCAGLSCFV
jgi:hypothetical protein